MSVIHVADIDDWSELSSISSKRGGPVVQHDRTENSAGRYSELDRPHAETALDEACRDNINAALARIHHPWSPRDREEQPLVPEAGDAFNCLNAVDLFADLSQDEIRAMDLMVPATHYGAGELVFSQAQFVESLFILKTGRIRIFRVTEDGKAITMAILGAGAVFGEMIQLGQRMYDNYAEAIEDSTVCRLNAADVEHFLLSDPRIAVRIARYLGDEISRLEDRLTDLTLRPLIARCAATLLKLAVPATSGIFGHSPVVRLTHEQLAGLVGASREATSKVMAEFTARGLVRQARGRITIVDADQLAQISRRTA